jgi:hypothetical protein
MAADIGVVGIAGPAVGAAVGAAPRAAAGMRAAAAARAAAPVRREGCFMGADFAGGG